MQAIPWIETWGFSLLYAIVGLGAVAFPFALRTPEGSVGVLVGASWGAAGVIFLLFGAFNYFAHIGLIVNTLPSG